MTTTTTTTTAHPPSYGHSEVSLPVPPYVAGKVSPFPSDKACNLSLRNIDKIHSDIVVSNFDDGDKLIFSIQVPAPSSTNAVEAKLARAVKELEQGWSIAAYLVVAADGNIPYVLRRQNVPSSTPSSAGSLIGSFDVVSVSPPLSLSSPSNDAVTLGELRKLTPKTSLFKTKYAFAGLSSRDWAWKGNVARNLSLVEYASSATGAVGGGAGEGAGSASGSSTPSSSSSGGKTQLADLTRSTNGASLHFPRPTEVESASLIVASLLPLLFSNRIFIAKTYTTEADLDRLLKQVRPSDWDSFFMSGGKGSEKQEKHKAQMERERLRDRKERSQSRNRNEIQGVIPALPATSGAGRSSMSAQRKRKDSNGAASSNSDNDDDTKARIEGSRLQTVVSAVEGEGEGEAEEEETRGRRE